MGLKMKATIGNVISLWFGADTPIREHKIKGNRELWAACQRVQAKFDPPSGASGPEQYRKADKVSFATAVQEELLQVQH